MEQRMLTTTLIGMLVIFVILIAEQTIRGMKAQAIPIDESKYLNANRHDKPFR